MPLVRIVLKSLVFLCLTALFAFLLAWPVELLWNWSLTRLPGIPRIDFLHAAALVALGRLLFGLHIVFLARVAIVAALLARPAEWAWNTWVAESWHLPAIDLWKAAGGVAFLQMLLGAGHSFSRWHRYTTSRWHARWHGEFHEQFERHTRHWHRWGRDIQRELKRKARHLERGGRPDAPERDSRHGAERNWRHFDRYWLERGKADFESWLREREI
jgi:hypothetical protein